MAPDGHIGQVQIFIWPIIFVAAQIITFSDQGPTRKLLADMWSLTLASNSSHSFRPSQSFKAIKAKEQNGQVRATQRPSLDAWAVSSFASQVHSVSHWGPL